MVFVAGRKGAAFRQQQDELAQLRQILAAPLSQLNVTPKLRTANQVPGRSNSQVLKQCVGGLVALALTSIRRFHRLPSSGIGNLYVERQGLLFGHSDEQNADRIGYRHTHCGQCFCGPLLHLLLHANVNHRRRHKRQDLAEIQRIAALRHRQSQFGSHSEVPLRI